LDRILLIGTEDWLFARHHLPAVRAAREMGLEPVVAVRDTGRSWPIIEAGARIQRCRLDSGLRQPVALWAGVTRLGAILDSERPLLAQSFGLRTALSLLAAGRIATTSHRRVLAFRGLSPALERPGPGGDLIRALARQVGGLVARGDSRLIFDNPDDPALLGLPTDGQRISIIGGSGIDPVLHTPEPMPWSPPLKLLFGSPLLWANGPDLAVAAVSAACAAGVDVTLSLVGAPCSPGRAAVPEATLNAWSRQRGIGWYAPSADLSDIWRRHHALLLPSRGGDGLPLVLSQAAAAARPMIVSDVGACRSFVRDGVDGKVVPVGEVAALAEAITLLARAPGLVERMGRAARERVLEGYTERAVMDALKQAWRAALANGAPA
jgi:Glycosyl transferases group 1